LRTPGKADISVEGWWGRTWSQSRLDTFLSRRPCGRVKPPLIEYRRAKWWRRPRGEKFVELRYEQSVQSGNRVLRGRSPARPIGRQLRSPNAESDQGGRRPAYGRTALRAWPRRGHHCRPRGQDPFTSGESVPLDPRLCRSYFRLKVPIGFRIEWHIGAMPAWERCFECFGFTDPRPWDRACSAASNSMPNHWRSALSTLVPRSRRAPWVAMLTLSSS